MYAVTLEVLKQTMGIPEVITDATTILELAGLDSKKGLKEIGMTSASDGVVFDKAGNYGYLPHGYYVFYEEASVEW